MKRPSPHPVISVRSHRPGWSLIEMLLMITLIAAFSTIAVRLLVLFLNAQSQAGIRAARELSLQRLEDSFRDDMRQAAQIRFSEQTAPDEQAAAVQLQLEQSSGTVVEYRFQDGEAQRQVRRDETVLVQDRFVLDGLEAAVTVDGPVLQLKFSDSPSDTRAGFTSCIEARPATGIGVVKTEEQAP